MTLSMKQRMSKQERIEKKKSSSRSQETQVEPPKKVDTEALKDDLDDILDEIDSVLEQNAEEFVRGYIQKGGE